MTTTTQPLSAAHWLMRAAEARALASQCDEPTLRRLMQEVADDYAALAACRQRADRSDARTASRASASPAC